MTYPFATPRCTLCHRAATEQTSIGYLCAVCAAKPDSAYHKDRVSAVRGKLSTILIAHDLQAEWNVYAETLGDFGDWSWERIANEFERKLLEWEIRYAITN